MLLLGFWQNVLDSKGPDNLYNLYKTKYDEEIQNFALQQMGRKTWRVQ